MELLAPILTIDFGLASLLALAGGFMFGFAGFGGGLIMTPLLTLIYWPTEGVVIANAIPIFVAWQTLPAIRPHIRWKEVAPLLAAAVVATPIGAYFLLVGDPEFIRRVMGAVVLFRGHHDTVRLDLPGPTQSLDGCRRRHRQRRHERIRRIGWTFHGALLSGSSGIFPRSAG